MLLMRLTRLMGKSHALLLRHYLLWVCGYCLMQGLTFVLVVPIIRALLDLRVDDALLWLMPLGVGVVLTGYLHYRAVYSGFQVAATLMNQLRRRIGDHVVTLPLGWFVRANTSRLGLLLSQGVMEILGLPAHQLTPLLRAVITPVVVVVATSFFDWRVALCAAFLFPMLGLVYWWAGRLGRTADRAVQTANVQACDRMVEFAQSQPVLRTYGKAAQGYPQFDQALVAQSRAARRQLWLVLPPLLLNTWLGQLALMALMVGITWLVVIERDTEQQTTLFALLVLVSRVIDPLSEVASYSSGIRMASTQMEAAENVLSQQSLPAPTEPVPLPQHYGIELRDVAFSYQQGVRVLKNVSATLPANSMTAVVGASGSGKTTLTKLIARFFDPDSGVIAIGGINVKHLPVAKHMNMISQVFQDNYLFSGTLRENLLMGNPTTDDDTLQNVLKLSRLDEVVQRLPLGLDSRVGEGGRLLSGGERQRAALARALLKNAPILLLDEATGALDPENQEAIAQGLNALRGRCTMLVIAHQLHTIRSADNIIVLDHGQIVEQGNHQQLLTMNGRYAAFWQAKVRAEGWLIVHPREEQGEDDV
ncbi:ABC transporter ATP-binding protein [Candidatus Symbiopectobacterium sp. NZEC135]|uniref:ABC transporter ATP-binding protein n=1 Tax=Candidatus Symbiopectobacterium sp. NZEC135 TaxID=2820471 RepID=UPI00222718C7|nr:ABC transporter ATP-binding protein [Candidatus Symbiopectobacterium sp. NZEC135]MCW2479377.1 ABC transporter ATP-binding protein [Candidatus Symbiopectobacterium sp. NZEC135]